MNQPLTHLHGALLESRQRWRDALMLAVDLVFETDAEGRFSFVAPDPALGHRSLDLLGQPAAALLMDPANDPFCRPVAARDLRVWLRHGDGDPRCLAMSLAPLLDAQGRPTGLRGTARDITRDERLALDTGAALRRSETIIRIMGSVKAEASAAARLKIVLEGFALASGCLGMALIDPRLTQARKVLHVGQTATGLSPRQLAAMAEAEEAAPAPWHRTGPHGGPMAVFGRRDGQSRMGVLVGWRAAGMRGFDREDAALLAYAAEILAGMVGQAHDHEVLAREAESDPLTGLYNRRGFMADLEKRLSRGQRSLLPGSSIGALIYLDLDNFKPLNDALGHAAGDLALKQVGLLLRDALRPADLLGRLGGDEFAAWLDGADSPVAAARATGLLDACAQQLAALSADARPLSMSIGIAALTAGTPETPALLVSRADAAMYAAKRSGRGRWSVAPPAEAA